MSGSYRWEKTLRRIEMTERGEGGGGGVGCMTHLSSSNAKFNIITMAITANSTSLRF